MYQSSKGVYARSICSLIASGLGSKKLRNQLIRLGVRLVAGSIIAKLPAVVAA